MDRTEDLAIILVSLTKNSNFALLTENQIDNDVSFENTHQFIRTPVFVSAPSPFVIHASDIISQLHSLDKLFVSSFDQFVGFHRYYSAITHKLACQVHACHLETPLAATSVQIGVENRDQFCPWPEAQCKDFILEVTSCVAEAGVNLKELKGLCESEKLCTENKSSVTHHFEIVSFISKYLATLAQQLQRMQKARQLQQQLVDISSVAEVRSGVVNSNETAPIGQNPRAFSFYDPFLSSLDSDVSENEEQELVGDLFENCDADTGNNRSSVSPTIVTEAKTFTKNGAEVTRKDRTQGEDLVRRFEGKIPSASLAYYDKLAQSHKALLLKEAKLMHARSDHEHGQALQMERSVTSISHLLGEFASILLSQSEQVAVLNTETKNATSAVASSSSELQKTLDRSEGHGYTLCMLAVGLALLLLLLDFCTP